MCFSLRIEQLLFWQFSAMLVVQGAEAGGVLRPAAGRVWQNEKGSVITKGLVPKP